MLVIQNRLTLLLGLIAAVVAAADAPVKLTVEANPRSLVVGEALNLRVSMVDAAGRAALAPKALAVLVQVRLPAGTVEALGTAALPAGQGSVTLVKPVRQTGLVYVWAKNPELLPGGQYVNVRPAVRVPRPKMSDLRREATPSTIIGGTVAPKMPAPPPPPASRAPAPEITLRYSPQRDFLANGADPASLEAFLVGDVAVAPADIHLTLFDSTGTMRPAPLTIRAGETVGHSTITSSAPGSVSVEYLGSNPPVEFQGDKTLNVKFVPPISRILVRASPPGISLVDTAEFIVSLADADGRTLVTDSARPVSLYLSSGRGQISRQDLVISPGSFDVRARFVPEWPGEVKVSAATPNLLTVDAPLNVGWPIALLVFSALGAVAGGLLSKQTRKRRDKWRVPTGLVTGFLFYWACIFLGLGALLGTAVLNPLSAFAVSAVGGWLQTEVFTIVGDLIRPRVAAGK